jgi:hypothetical protein
MDAPLYMLSWTEQCPWRDLATPEPLKYLRKIQTSPESTPVFGGATIMAASVDVGVLGSRSG